MEITRFLSRVMRKSGSYLFSKQQRMMQYYVQNYEKIQLQENTILYEVRDGQTIVDSPFSFYKKMISDERFLNYTHIWVIDRLENPALQNIDRDNARVKVVVRQSKQYFYWLLAAKFLVNSSTFPNFFIKKEKQIYINTWHGTPLKTMGYNIPGDPSQSQNVVRNFLMADYLLSANPLMTKMYQNDYKLNGIFAGKIIEEGYPRIDWTVKYGKNNVFKDFDELNLTFDPSFQSILYCPTWKGKKITKTNDDIEQIIQETLYLKEKFSGKYNFFIKVHPFIYHQVAKNQRVKDFLIPDSFDANKCLAGIDILITDYSSIFFDFLVTKKPILFYVWDNDIYAHERGSSIEENELPGPVAYTVQDIIAFVENISSIKEKYQTKYDALRQTIVSKDDGYATERYLEYIFLGKSSQELKIIYPNREKEHILFFPGRMKNNGITSSFLNLVSNLDYSAFDVSILIANPLTKEELKNVKLIPTECRLLFRPGKHAYTFLETITDYYFESFGVHAFSRKFYPKNAYVREMKRLLGNSSVFKVAIDFSGYSFFWGKFIAAVNSNKKVVFQHNDLLSDSRRTVNGKQPHKTNLKSLFSIYQLFDRILSVSQETMEINKKNLAQYIRPEQVGVVRNSLNIHKIVNSEVDETFEEDVISIQRETVHLTIRKDSVFDIYPQISSLLNKDYRATHITHNDALRSVARYTHQGKTYYKLIINDMYQGWINSENVKSIVKSKVDLSNVQLIGTINVSSDPVFYADLNQIQNGLALPLNKTYVFLAKKTVGLNDDYFLAENEKGALGWIKSSSITNIHHLGKFSVLKWVFLSRNPKYSLVNPAETPNETRKEKSVPLISPENFNFVTMGRLSPEKNQINLVRAFSTVVTSFPNARLFILGNGELRKELISLIQALDLQDHVWLLGHVDNPGYLLKQCDLFVLPSYYEGQPMVLLEGLTLGMKILASNIPANRSVIGSDYGFYINGTDAETIAESLVEQIQKGFPNAPRKFDPYAYNQSVLGEFYEEIM